MSENVRCAPLSFEQYKAPVTLSRFEPRFTTTHPDLTQMVKSGCIGMRRDGKKKKFQHQYDVSRCSYGVSTIRLRTHYDSWRQHQGGATNAHDASTIRYGASTIQAGSATVASRPATNLHDLVVVMRQSQGGGEYSHFLFIRRLGPSIYRSPPPQKKKKKKKKEFQEPPKILENFSKSPKYHPFCTFTLKKTQKCIEVTPKYSLVLWWPPQNTHKIFIPQKMFIFLKTRKKLNVITLNPKNYPRLRMYENIKVPPHPPPDDSLQKYDTKYYYLFNLWRSQSCH